MPSAMLREEVDMSTVWFFFPTANVTDTEAGFQFPLPGWSAVNEQLPADTIDTDPPDDTVQTPGVEEAYE